MPAVATNLDAESGKTLARAGGIPHSHLAERERERERERKSNPLCPRGTSEHASDVYGYMARLLTLRWRAGFPLPLLLLSQQL